jgi:quercetin dioxygenase-like cupin family protein
MMPTIRYDERLNHKRKVNDEVKIIRQDLAAAKPADNPAMFTGEVRMQNLVAEGDAPSQRVTAVTFLDGARNTWHQHTTEQVLVVTHGEGLVADNDGEHPITIGDVVLIQPNERHWHGARPGKDMTHLAILLPGRMTVLPVDD